MMYRFFSFLGLSAAILALPASHFLISAGPPPAPPNKVDVCHNGHVINVSANAVGAHVSQHGDCTDTTSPLVINRNTDGSCVCVVKQRSCVDCSREFQECRVRDTCTNCSNAFRACAGNQPCAAPEPCPAGG